MGFDKEASSSSHVLKVPSLPREDTPLLGKKPPRSSQFKTFANVFIAIVGAGVLGLPYTFKKTGWIMGSLMLFSVAFLTYYCMMLLVYTRRKLESYEGFSKIASFGDLGFAVCGPIGRFSVDAMIVLAQAGFCVSYLIFIAHTLAYVFNHQSNEKIMGFLSPKAMYIWGCFPFQLGLNSIPTLTHLAPLSIFADVVDLGAMGVVMVEDVVAYLKYKPALQAFGGFSVFFYGLGVAVYAFEGIGMVLPLESEAKDKDKFGKVLGGCMAFIALLYGGFGILGYFAFGEETKDIITTNLGRGLLSSLVQFGLCVNLFFTFPLMMNPVYEVAERRFCGSSYCLWLRWVVVLLVSLVALLVPNFADFLSLVGSSVCCALGFVLPSLFHLMVFKDELSWKGLAIDTTILVFGVVVALTGTWSSLLEIFVSKSS
ncbi:amino acid transporter AVT3B [Ricinus communis]|uniref:Amino acid transporter, putative n=1 Tax=Ricinus communis TaxID=3988 RepID=B9S6V9_RICCO|nr:amino acid transporter AVT3B [Ricinus communis]EEF40715.1 amino acid transporter, putative [Ricinus communis]|eukprot:XP_002521728.1 amino acid transporter AVT3B [Ricinus communis]